MVMIKSKSVLKCSDHQLSDGLIEKKWYLMDKMVLCGTLLKRLSAFIFSGKAGFFLESVSFHSLMLGANNFRLVLGNCIVIAMIFIKKYIVNIFRISFL